MNLEEKWSDKNRLIYIGRLIKQMQLTEYVNLDEISWDNQRIFYLATSTSEFLETNEKEYEGVLD